MVKLTHKPTKWLAVLILVTAAVLVITGCPPAEPPTVNQPAVNEPPANQPPVIDSLTSQWRQVKKNMSVPVECAARDPDGDELSYSWSVDGGDISGDGAVGDWSTPDENGAYTITVTVTDGRGGWDTESLEIRVACCLREADE
jgi:hypothetical protein